MSGLNIIVIVSVILFARLGVRLYVRWQELKDDSDKKEPEP